MKTVITILVVVFLGFLACDTPEPATTNPVDSTMINRNKPDTSMMTDTIPARRDSIPHP